MKILKTIKKHASGEIVERKSRFIANCYAVSSEKEIATILQQIANQYVGARHHCYAYRIEEQGIMVERASDDGEPSGTAGAPMLTILQKHNLVNILVVVTRYFGGTLLGTGGLVRAYTQATNEAIKLANIVEITPGYELELQIQYKDLDMFQYYCKNLGIYIRKIQYEDNITMTIDATDAQKEEILNNLSNFKFQVIHTKILQKKYVTNNLNISTNTNKN